MKKNRFSAISFFNQKVVKKRAIQFSNIISYDLLKQIFQVVKNALKTFSDFKYKQQKCMKQFFFYL